MADKHAVTTSKPQCVKCDNKINTGDNFCSKCGTKVIIVKDETLDDILNTEIDMTELIYDDFDTSKKEVTYKIKELFGKDNYTFSFLGSLEADDFMSDTFEFNGPNNIVLDKRDIRNDMVISSERTRRLLMATKTTPRKSRSNIKLMALFVLGIKHTYRRALEYGITTDTIRDLLIAFIENSINNPVCGFNIGGSVEGFQMLRNQAYNWHGFEPIDPEKTMTIRFHKIKDKYAGDYYSKIKENFKANQLIINNQTIKNDAKKLAEYNSYLDHNANHHIEHLKSQKIVENKLSKLDWYIKVQKELDAQLDKIKQDLFYSKKYKKIYTKGNLVDIMAKFDKMFDLNLGKHSELFKIRHINIYILNREIDGLIDLAKRNDDIGYIMSHMSIREGAIDTEVRTKLLGCDL